ncbi:hypothetical protein TIFTF001_048967 [Ficus carica]|uniref:Leucine-rich repeat-containing N-terminal plant-type domain-containing protein n=1 Tax=Ficus carica TaxID=3494 RepID=A0AA87YZK7_FICCA|nr:hypothetical protein TIFTF001_048967 [Ficus carica]
MNRMKHETLLSYLFLLLISCCFFVSHSLNSSSTTSLGPFPCLPSQSSALLQLKQESAFSHAKILENWIHTTDCCSWVGVTCNATNGQVVGLDLRRSGIHGPLSPNSSLFNLLHLERLNLALNNFNFSAIPPTFGKLSRLTHLDLSYSLFSGKVPPEIARLTELVSLDLSSFGDSSHPVVVDMSRLVQNLTKLRVLHLDQVTSFSSSIHKSLLVNLSSLTSLSLRGSYLDGEFPDYIFNLPKIEAINMSQSQFLTDGLGFLPEFQSGSNLKLLDMSSIYHLSGKLPDSIGNLKSLIVLNLGQCDLSGPIPSSISNLSQLERLDLSLNSFEGPLSSNLGNLKKLTVLYLSGNKIQGDLPHSLRNLTQLEELDLSFCNFNSQILNLVTNLVKLKKLLLHYGSFIGQIPSSLGNLTRLEELDLSDNSFSGQVPMSIGHLTSLKQLDLSDNSFSGQIPSSLGNLRQLEDLDLSDNSFRGQIPLSLGNLGHLVALDLSHNAFTGKFPLALANLTRLKRLDLFSNQLTEVSDPSNALEKLTALTSLDLSNNSISGIIPSSFFRIPTLEFLTLNQNQLTSIDNHNISSSPLYSLDLSFNNLTIEFSIFSGLGHLKVLHLSRNNVSMPNKGENFTFPKFNVLDLSWSNIRQFPVFLKTQYELYILDLSNNKIEGKIPKWFWTIGKEFMSELYLSNNFISGWEEAASSIIPTWQTWRLLDLRANNLTGTVAPLLCELGLVFLDLSKNHLNGTIPQCFGNSSDLVVLHLQENNFHGNLSNDMFTEQGCEIFKALDLSNNRLQGKVPQSLIKCQSLELLNLGYNQMSDVFPFWLQNLTNLKVLILGSNKFEGPIWSVDRPLAFAELQILDLSYNHFSGVLPSEFFKNWTSMSKALKDQEPYSTFLDTHLPAMGGISYDEPIMVLTNRLFRRSHEVLTGMVEFLTNDYNLRKSTFPIFFSFW